MANKEKPYMDYWQHSTILFDDDIMQILIAMVGVEGYLVYCYLMEKINRLVKKDYIFDDNTKWLTINKLRLTEQKFNDILHKMLELGMFNKQKYNQAKILTNDYSIKNKKAVLDYRNDSKLRMQEKRAEEKQLQENCSCEQSDCSLNNNNANVLYKKEEIRNKKKEKSNKKEEIRNKKKEKSNKKEEISDKNIIIFIGNKKITKITDLYPIISNLFNKDSLNETELMELERLWCDNPYSLCNAIEICQKSATKGININYLLKAYQQAKSLNLAKNEPINSELDNEETSQTHSEEELEDLKKGFIERRNKRRNSKNQDSESFDNTSESINEAEELERLKAERRRKKEESKND